jgi:hypothetical protein
MQPPLQKGNQVRKPLSKDEILNCIIGTEQERPKYKPGAPMLSEPNLEAARPNCARMHSYVMEHNKDKLALPAKVDQHYFKGGCGALMSNIAFSSVYNLITMASLDVTFSKSFKTNKDISLIPTTKLMHANNLIFCRKK